MRFNFFDDIALDGSTRRTSDGYIAAVARVARTGIQEYKGSEVGRPAMDVVRVYRPPEEVFHKDAMKSLAHRPVTLDHPPCFVDSKNWKTYAKGQSGDEVTRDGDTIRVPMIMMDATLIHSFDTGQAKQCSVGYSTELKWGKGKTPAGEVYDAKQTKIRANHIAIVPEARGGNKLTVGDKKICDKCGEKMTDGKCVDCNDGDMAMGDFRSLVDRIQKLEDNSPLGGDGDGDEDDIILEIDPEVKKKLKILASNHVAPVLKKAAAAALRTFLCENYGDDKGDEMYAELTKGITLDSLPPYWITDRDFSEQARKSAAKRGAAMPDGSFPIENAKDLRNAIREVGRAENSAAAKRHIIRRAKALGATGILPKDWKGSSTKDAKASGSTGEQAMTVKTILVDGIPVDLEEQSAAVVQRTIERLTKELGDAKKAKDDVDEEQENEKKTRGAKEADDKKSIDTLKGENEVLKKQVKDATDPASLDKLVKDRQEAFDSAKPLLPSNYVFDGKSVAEVRKAAVVAKLGDAAAKDMSDASIEGAFKALAAATPKGAQRLADGLSRSAQGYSRDTGSSEAEKAYDERDKQLRDSWKTPVAGDAYRGSRPGSRA